MKRTLTAIMALIFAVVIFAHPDADKIKGVWTNDQKNIRIEFFKVPSGYAAKIVWLAKPNDEHGNPRLDKANPDPDLRNKPLVGTVIMYDLEFDGKNYVSGKFYGPKRGVIADCSVKMISPDKIEVTGKKGFFNDTKTWTRYK